MKIIWLCNTLIPEIAEKIGVKKQKPESWISSTYKNLYDDKRFSIMVLYPNENNIPDYKQSNFIFKSYFQRNTRMLEQKQVDAFINILEEFDPDAVHIFGTEYPHSLAMAKACHITGYENRILVSIQGLVSIYAKHYYCYLPEKIIKRYSLRDFIKNDNIYQQKKAFEKRGRMEIETIGLTKNVLGRTDFDKACILQMNPNAKYHHCNEVLRDSFYKEQWKLDLCEPYSIFVSQSNYPIKGFHLMLETLSVILKRYPQAHLYTTGKNPILASKREKLLQTSYQKYLGELIHKYNLFDHVTFLGYLDEKAMCSRFLKSNVFVNCSSIENSPNSLGEAMILGMPIVSSDVGGVKNLLVHNEEGFIYQADAPYMMAYYIMELFNDTRMAVHFGENARKHALVTHNHDKNIARLIEIYHTMQKQ